MKTNMKQVTVKMLVLAAAAVTPHLLEVGTPTLQARSLDGLSVKERKVLKTPECKSVYRVKSNPS